MKKIEIHKNSRYTSGPRRLQKTAEYKYVYLEKRNNFIRDMLKKLFFIFLVLFFSKKHEFYKRKVKNFILHLRVKIFGSNMSLLRLIFVTLIKFYLRVKYLKYYRVSSVHLHALFTLNKFIEACKPLNIDFFLTAGCLLGVARGQQCIAGSAGDVDLGVREEDLKKLYMIGPQLEKKGLQAIRQWPKENNQLDTISFFFNDGPSHIDVNVYRKIKKNNRQMWWGDKQRSRYKKHFNGVFLPGSYFVKLRLVKFYNKKFKAPYKPELYLEQKYGKNWKKLDFKNHNYFLRENKYV